MAEFTSLTCIHCEHKFRAGGMAQLSRLIEHEKQHLSNARGASRNGEDPVAAMAAPIVGA